MCTGLAHLYVGSRVTRYSDGRRGVVQDLLEDPGTECRSLHDPYEIDFGDPPGVSRNYHLHQFSLDV